MRILGIDPGYVNAAAALFANGELERAWKFPYSKKESRIDEPLLAQQIRACNADIAFVERVHAMPKQGVSSTFKLGQGYGLILGILAGLGIPTRLVHPPTWKAATLPDERRTKKLSVERAVELFPDFDFTPTARAYTPDDNMAEAALIAVYGNLLLTGEIKD